MKMNLEDWWNGCLNELKKKGFSGNCYLQCCQGNPYGKFAKFADSDSTTIGFRTIAKEEI